MDFLNYVCKQAGLVHIRGMETVQAVNNKGGLPPLMASRAVGFELLAGWQCLPPSVPPELLVAGGSCRPRIPCKCSTPGLSKRWYRNNVMNPGRMLANIYVQKEVWDTTGRPKGWLRAESKQKRDKGRRGTAFCECVRFGLWERSKVKHALLFSSLLKTLSLPGGEWC